MRGARIPNDREGIMKSLGRLAAIGMASLWASGAHAAGTCNLGSGRVTNVQPAGGGCISGPTGGSVQSWDVQQAQSYRVTLSNVTDCAAGGTAGSIQVMV